MPASSALFDPLRTAAAGPRQPARPRAGRSPAPLLDHPRLEAEAEGVAAAIVAAPPLAPALALRASRGKPVPSAGAGATALPLRRAAGRPADRRTVAGVEARTGADLSGVRVHDGPEAAASAATLGARAFATGRDVVFGRGRHAPATREGRRLLAHELTHVVQQRRTGSAAVQRAPATPAEQREFVRMTIEFLEESADFFRDRRQVVTPALFDRLLTSWYTMVVNQERIVDDDLGGDATLKRDLRAAYTAALRVLMPRAAQALGVSETDLYDRNNGRIPMWAWTTPHRLESGFSAPVAEGRGVDPLTGNVAWSQSGFDVVMLPDAEDASLAAGGKANVRIQARAPGYSWESQGGQRIVTAFDPPARPTATIQVVYAPGARASDRSGYGRGTTPEDVAGGAVTPRSTSLGFHEAAHVLDYVRFLEEHPAPAFGGRVGMTEADFLAARQAYVDAIAAYQQAARDYTTARTHCVGTTVDAFHEGEEEFELECAGG